MGSAYRGYRDLKVYQLSYTLALQIFETSKLFPPEEKYSLTDQIRRCSRLVPANIAEAWRRRKYERAFVNKLTDSLTEATEVMVWLDFAKDLAYIDSERHQIYLDSYDEVQRMLSSMVNQPGKFCHS